MAGTAVPVHLAGSPFQRACSCRSRHAPTARGLSAWRDVRAGFLPPGDSHHVSRIGSEWAPGRRAWRNVVAVPNRPWRQS